MKPPRQKPQNRQYRRGIKITGRYDENIIIIFIVRLFLF